MEGSILDAYLQRVRGGADLPRVDCEEHLSVRRGRRLIEKEPKSHRLCVSAKDQAPPGSRHWFDQVRRYIDMLCCSQSVGSRGSTRYRIASRYPGPIHIDRRTAEENLFVRRGLAKGSSHRRSICRPK